MFDVSGDVYLPNFKFIIDFRHEAILLSYHLAFIPCIYFTWFQNCLHWRYLEFVYNRVAVFYKFLSFCVQMNQETVILIVSVKYHLKSIPGAVNTLKTNELNGVHWPYSCKLAIASLQILFWVVFDINHIIHKLHKILLTLNDDFIKVKNTYIIFLRSEIWSVSMVSWFRYLILVLLKLCKEKIDEFFEIMNLIGR